MKVKLIVRAMVPAPLADEWQFRIDSLYDRANQSKRFCMEGRISLMEYSPTSRWPGFT